MLQQNISCDSKVVKPVSFEGAVLQFRPGRAGCDRRLEDQWGASLQCIVRGELTTNSACNRLSACYPAPCRGDQRGSWPRNVREFKK